MAGAATLETRRPETQAALTCGVCLLDFDAGCRRPLILPHCGHTFCRLCIKDLGAANDIVCPSCRCKYPNVDPDSLPINFNIQCLAASTKVFPTVTEMEDKSNFCVEHEIRLAFWCSSCEAAVCGECLYENHPRPSHTICRIQEVVEQVKDRARTLASQSCQDVVGCLGRSLARTLQDVSDVQEAAHLLQETSRVNRLAHVASDLASITSVFESAKAVHRRVSALDGGGQEGGVEEVATVYIERDLSTRPSILALSDNGGLAPVKVEDKGIHIYSLRSTSTAYSVAVKLNVLLACVKKDSPLVFLDIKAGERRLGRVYIRLEGSMRRSQQFMALCLGSLGPTYRGTRFDGMSERGMPGEYVRGGDYQARAGLGGEALMDSLEWDGPWSRPKAAGQVCGVGGEDQKKFGALFAICLRDNPDDIFRGPFGSVEEGLDVLEVACRHEPFNKVHIGDCGVVIAI